MTEFQQKLVLTVVDKLVFGLLIVLAGFNRALEDYRSEQATQAEIARLQRRQELLEARADVVDVMAELS
jgi:hypothetical protein